MANTKVKVPMKTREYDENTKDKNGDLQPLVEYCMDIFDLADNSEYRKKKIKEIKDSRKAYEQETEDATFPWKDASNVVLPLTSITVDNLEPRLAAGLVGKDPFIQFEMDGQTTKDEPTAILEDWFNSELRNTVKVIDVAMDTVHELLLEGTTYLLEKYDADEDTKRDFVFDQEGNIMMGDDGAPLTEDKVDPLFEGGRMEFVPFTDMYLADDVDDWDKADFARVVRPTYGELQNLKDEHGYISDSIGPWLLQDATGAKIPESARTPAQDLVGVEVHGKETIECLEFHVRFCYAKLTEENEEDQDNFEDEKLVVLIAKESQCILRHTLLRELNFKNRPLIRRVRILAEKGRSYGTSIYGKMKSIQNGASETFNRAMNSGDIAMMPWFIYGKKSGLQGTPEIYPGAGVEADDASDVVFPKFSFDAAGYLSFIELWLSFWERVLSIGDIQIGRSRDKDMTATETLAVIQEGNIKHNYQSRSFKEDFIEALRTVYDLYYQHMPIDTKHPYQGQLVPITRQAMSRSVRWKLTGSTELANKVIERKTNEDFYRQLRQDPMVNPIPVVKDLVRTYRPDENPDDYINPAVNQFWEILQANPEIEQVIQKYMQTKMETQQELEASTEEADADLLEGVA